MLSSTYIQVAMQVENDRFRQELVWLKRRAESIAWQEEEADGELGNLFQVVSRFRRQCCSRRVERHFLPELKKQAGVKTRQMAEHDALHRFAVALHASVCRAFYRQFSGEKDSGKLLQKYIGGYCHTMMQMLDEEETLVFSLAHECFSNENWIYLAGIFMQEESGNDGLPIVHELDVPDDVPAYQADGLMGRQQPKLSCFYTGPVPVFLKRQKRLPPEILT